MDPLLLQLAELRETVEDLAWQFGHRTVKDGRRCLSSGGLSALEGAFQVLGWPDPYPVPEGAPGGCDAAGCAQWSSAGVPTQSGGYLHLCPRHYTDFTDGPGVTRK